VRHLAVIVVAGLSMIALGGCFPAITRNSPQVSGNLLIDGVPAEAAARAALSRYLPDTGLRCFLRFPTFASSIGVYALSMVVEPSRVLEPRGICPRQEKWSWNAAFLLSHNWKWNCQLLAKLQCARALTPRCSGRVGDKVPSSHAGARDARLNR